jgi:fatty-acyl-CoA synthase
MKLIERVGANITFFKGVIRTLRQTVPIARNPERVFPLVIQELAQRFGERPALISERESFNYRALAERSNRYARWALAKQLVKGDTVCLLMTNRPEYMAVWMGITRAGGIVALLNTNLFGPSLAHCIDLVRPRHLIVAAELTGAFASAQPLLRSQPLLWSHGEGPFSRIDQQIEQLSGNTLSAAERVPLTIEDRALYIYTSGTTGLPKAANVNHYRIMLAAFGFAGVMDTNASDRMYDCLPMYHTAGGLVATGAVLVNGGSVVIREKFSAREFWPDVARHDCTLFQYIGELCRYLLNTPPGPNDTAHRLRLACGNGLRPDIWNAFKQRFRIPQIMEFYAATEGNVLMFNFDGKPGAIGRLPWFAARRFPMKLIRVDVETGEPLRGPDGLCSSAGLHETGEAVGKIVQDSARPGNRFEGYSEAAENANKILRNVLEKGDFWFRSGDLMQQDENGYFYFVDRIGDTFRWKGENVSTTQVAEIINLFPGVKETTVYGVRVPGHEGCAGMAALVCEGGCDFVQLRANMEKHLPPFARPLFLRLRDHIDATSTFKQRKIDLTRQGLDPDQTDDPLYFNDAQARAFVRLDRALYQRIQTGQVRL